MISFADAPAGKAALDQAPSAVPSTSAVEAMQVDWQQVRATEKFLTRSDTGIFTYPALLLFLEREFARNELFQRPFSLIVIEVGLAGNQPLKSEAMKALAQRIEKFKRKTDTLTHFEMFGLAILLPETLTASARGFVTTLKDALYSAEMVPGIANDAIKLEFGASGIPDECKSLEMLLAMAKPKKA